MKSHVKRLKNLLSTISIWGESIYRKRFLRFVIFAILNKYNNDPILQRLAEHEDCLDTLSFSLEYIEYLLTDIEYSRYKESMLFSLRNESHALSVYTFQITKNLRFQIRFTRLLRNISTISNLKATLIYLAKARFSLELIQSANFYLMVKNTLILKMSHSV